MYLWGPNQNEQGLHQMLFSSTEPCEFWWGTHKYILSQCHKSQFWPCRLLPNSMFKWDLYFTGSIWTCVDVVVMNRVLLGSPIYSSASLVDSDEVLTSKYWLIAWRWHFEHANWYRLVRSTCGGLLNIHVALHFKIVNLPIGILEFRPYSTKLLCTCGDLIRLNIVHTRGYENQQNLVNSKSYSQGHIDLLL